MQIFKNILLVAISVLLVCCSKNSTAITSEVQSKEQDTVSLHELLLTDSFAHFDKIIQILDSASNTSMNSKLFIMGYYGIESLSQGFFSFGNLGSHDDILNSDLKYYFNYDNVTFLLCNDYPKWFFTEGSESKDFVLPTYLVPYKDIRKVLLYCEKNIHISSSHKLKSDTVTQYICGIYKFWTPNDNDSDELQIYYRNL